MALLGRHARPFSALSDVNAVRIIRRAIALPHLISEAFQFRPLLNKLLDILEALSLHLDERAVISHSLVELGLQSRVANRVHYLCHAVHAEADVGASSSPGLLGDSVLAALRSGYCFP